LDWQPDTDLLVDSQAEAQLEEQAGEEAVRPDDQVTGEPEPTATKPGPAPRSPGATLEAFFRMLGATLVAARPQPPAGDEADGHTRPSPQVARDNVKQALQDLRELQTAEDHGPRHRYLHIVAPAALVAVVVGIFMLFPGVPQSLSPQLIGSWETSARKYADRTLQLSDGEIAFQQSPENGFASYPITGVTSRRDADGALIYVVTYDNDGMTHQFSFIHQPVANTITLKNQPRVVWRKTEDPSSILPRPAPHSPG